MFPLGLRFYLDLATFMFPSDSVILRLRSLVILRYMFHALPFTISLCFPRAHYVSYFHFLGLRSFPLTLSYCLRLDYSDLILVSRSGASAP